MSNAPVEVFSRSLTIPASPEEVFAWHARPGALQRLTPPWEHIDIEGDVGPLENGSRTTFRIGAGPMRPLWVAEHYDVNPPKSFGDRQIEGPFTRWEHEHRIEPRRDGCVLEDRIEYVLPLGSFGRRMAGSWVRRKLARTFVYRHRVTLADITAHQALRARSGGRPMKILVTGASGVIGSALVPFLTTGGHEVARLVRHPALRRGEVHWDPAAGTIDTTALEGLDAVVHLAGEPIAGKWDPAKKIRILESRARGTRIVADAIAKLERPPRVLVSASAIGFYGDRGDEALDEASRLGEGFLAEVCRDWESATQDAADRGVRVVHARIGMALTLAGGALEQMLPGFRAGVAGTLGSGTQIVSWVSLDDVVGAIAHALVTDEIKGPMNVVAPSPVTNAELTRTLGRILRRPAILPVPEPLLRLAFGELADEALLASAHVTPRRLGETGYRFRHPTVEGALRHTLGEELAG
jgi:uncharacterized protein (TIGR01777 family)